MGMIRSGAFKRAGGGRRSVTACARVRPARRRTASWSPQCRAEWTGWLETLPRQAQF